jgi:hypothetical protein
MARRRIYAKMFHVKHPAPSRDSSILQNNPMDQKIALLLQTLNTYQILLAAVQRRSES